MNRIALVLAGLTIFASSMGQNKPKQFPQIKSPFLQKPSASRQSSAARSNVGPAFRPKFHREKNAVFADIKNGHVDKASAIKQIAPWLGLDAKHTFQKISESTDNLGWIHTRLRQTYNGIPIEGKTLMMHSKGDVVHSVNGEIEEPAGVDLTELISGDRAKQIALSHLKVSRLIQDRAVETVLFSVPGKETSVRLAHKVRVDSYSPFEMCYLFVDARTGEVLHKRNLMAHVDAAGTGQTLYSGTQNITVDNQNGTFRLRESARKIQTFDASAAGDVTVDGFSGATDYSGSSSNFAGVPQLTTFTISGIAQDWWFTTFADETPDLYIVLKDASHQVVYTSAVASDQNPSVQFSGINVFLNNPPYTLELWDDDGLEADDLGGSYSIEASTGSKPWSGSGNSGSYEVATSGHPALDVHWGMEKTYDFYLNVLNRNSYDGNGGLIRNFVNLQPSDDFPSMPNNAFALPAPFNMMVYGSGDGSFMNPVVSLDVEGHEFTHLVVDNNGNGGLNYEGESGALNESFADIFGTSVEFYAKGSEANWTIAEDIMVSSAFLRSMADPNLEQHPKTYGGTFWIDPSNLASDHGGVHANSGVQNYWFYLLSEGGSGMNDLGNGYTVEGIGIEDAQKIAYRNLVTYLGEAATYYDAFTGSLQAAQDLFGNPSTQYNAVRNAWYAVGIGADPNSYCSGTTSLTASSGDVEDGSGAANYNNNSHCRWLIAPPGATQVILNFNSFDTETGFDTLMVYDGPDETYPMIAMLWGNTLPGSVSTSPGNGAMFLRFRTDTGQTGQGWSASYVTSGISPSCGGVTLLSATTGAFDDGSSNDFYGNNQNCSWYIAPPCATGVTLTFSQFNTELNYDGVVIYDDFESTTPIATLSGSTIPSPVTSTTGKMRVVFVSDFSTTAPGFSAAYTSTGSAQCSGVTTLNDTDHGTIADGSSANVYCNNLDCRWLIQPPQAKKVTLSFTAFDVEAASSDGQTIFDAVEVYDGSTTSAPLLGRFSGSNIPPAVTSSGGSMLIRFYSDFATSAQGWSANYTSSQTVACSGSTTTLTATAGTFSDGSGTGLYANNTHCSWLIQPNGAEAVALTFTAFNTEVNKDGVIVYDGINSTAPVLARFSGTTIPDFVVSTGKSLFVEFLTDASGRGEGWTAEFTKATITEAENLLFERNVKVFPNPSNGNLKVESTYPEETAFDVIDMFGRQAIQPALLKTGTNFVDASTLPDGVYFLQVKPGNKHYAKRIVIRK